MVPVLLTRELWFPDPASADSAGLLALGGDLSVERLLLAYSLGIFPWYSEGDPILWWSPDPRMVLFPKELHVPSRLARKIRQKRFSITFDQDFGAVIRACASASGREQEGTWITREMQEAYVRLHRAGYAHSVEAWRDGKLVGGLYGVALGRVFFGESMFFHEPDASKHAFVHLVKWLDENGFGIIDCQVSSAHLARFGAREIERSEFIRILSRLRFEKGLSAGSWSGCFVVI